MPDKATCRGLEFLADGRADPLRDSGVRAAARGRALVVPDRGRRRPGRLRGAGHPHEPVDGGWERRHQRRLEAGGGRRLRRALRADAAADARRPVVDLRPALLRRRLRLLLVPPHPPRGAGLLGQPRRPPLLPALQPLDRAAADLDADDLAADTERIGRLPAPVELVFNTPSHHRVHHGSNELYLDRNYGGILIVWDRLFGTFQGETERVKYGLTQILRTFRPTRVACHEFGAVSRDVRGADSWRHRLGYLFRGPGWSPDGRGGGTRG